MIMEKRWMAYWMHNWHVRGTYTLSSVVNEAICNFLRDMEREELSNFVRFNEVIDLETKYERYKKVCKELCVNPEDIECFGEQMTHDRWINEFCYKVQSKNRNY